ncbi:hypothetical protein [Ectopseudomonas hydrolytica]|uniref:hypothetical protein n=1 Tax=Ectopseudomonas hydrolytica TaxID=2493633 RepID=UPI003C2E0044
MLSLGNNGAIVGLPEQYRPATLEIEFSTEATVEKIQIEVAKNKLTLPQCIMKLLKTSNASDISLSASWYHEASSLPHYINVNFYDPGYNPKKWANSGYSILFNLANAKIIDMAYSQVSPDESSSQLHPVNLSCLCQNQEIANFLDAKSTP